jgi:hypothetical protein
LGKKVKCPKCQNAFTARAEPPPAAAKPRRPAAPPPEEEEEAPRPRKPARREEQYEDEPSARRRKAAPPPEEEEEAPRARRRRDEDEEEEEAPRRRRRDRDDEDEDYEVDSIRKPAMGSTSDWKKLRLGFTFLIGGQLVIAVSAVLWLLMCGLIFAGIASAVSVNPAKGGDPFSGGLSLSIVGLVVLVVLPWVTELVWGGLTLTGHVFTIPAPAAHGAKTLAIVSLCLAGWNILSLVGTLLLGGLNSMMMMSSGGPGVGPGVGPGAGPGAGGGPNVGGFLLLPGILTWPAYIIVFLFCIRSLSQALKKQGLAKSSIYLMILNGVGFVMPCVAFCILFIGAMGAASAAVNARNQGAAAGAFAGVGILAIILYAIVFLVWLGAYIWYLVLLFQMRSAISERVERA